MALLRRFVACQRNGSPEVYAKNRSFCRQKEPVHHTKKYLAQLNPFPELVSFELTSTCSTRLNGTSVTKEEGHRVPPKWSVSRRKVSAC